MMQLLRMTVSFTSASDMSTFSPNFVISTGNWTLCAKEGRAFAWHTARFDSPPYISKPAIVVQSRLEKDTILDKRMMKGHLNIREK